MTEEWRTIRESPSALRGIVQCRPGWTVSGADEMLKCCGSPAECLTACSASIERLKHFVKAST